MSELSLFIFFKIKLWLNNDISTVREIIKIIKEEKKLHEKVEMAW